MKFNADNTVDALSWKESGLAEVGKRDLWLVRPRGLSGGESLGNERHTAVRCVFVRGPRGFVPSMEVVEFAVARRSPRTERERRSLRRT